MQDIGVFYPNMFHIFSECPMKFHRKYAEQISIPVLDKNFSVGKNIHALASYYLKGENINKFENVLTLKEKEYWDYLKNNEYFNYEPIYIEKNIIRKLDKYWIGGRLDALVKSGENIYILDYKTGKIQKDMTFDFQTMTYCLLCEDIMKEFNSLTFIYIDLKNKIDIKIEYNINLKREYEALLIKLCDRIQKFEPKNFSFPNNCNCEYSRICCI